MQKPIDMLTIGSLSNTEALDRIAQLIDYALDNVDVAIAGQSLLLADELETRGLQPSELALLDYFRANAWACRYQPRLSNRKELWDFEQPEVRQQVFLLRRAAHSPGFATMNAVHRCQILTNLGNQLDTLGRFVEARANWSAALAINSSFWMARANRGHGLMHYAAALYDQGQREFFAFRAHNDLIKAVSHIAKYPHLGDKQLLTQLSKKADQIAHHYNIKEIAAVPTSDLWGMGAESTERDYRMWCLNNVLFLNPLNDVEATSIAAYDILNLPTFTTMIDEAPVVIGMFNELKQGFVSARWLLWEGAALREPHFSDREVRLVNTLDYPAYGLSVEKVKIAFRIAYSIFDKIAYFLNHYLALNIPEKRISFRTIWREKDSGPVRDRFLKSENWPLRGLFWLSKDLFDDDMRDSTEPEASALADLRNHLEHKYVKVHEVLLSPMPLRDPFHDTLAYAITRTDLERRTLRLMQLVRSALIYLSLAMHHEERTRERSTKEKMATMSLATWRDEWNC
jgi:hypothetical protein